MEKLQFFAHFIQKNSRYYLGNLMTTLTYVCIFVIVAKRMHMIRNRSYLIMAYLLY